ncbi:hypothetical protein RJ641_020088, partial [Dillenia turbinata]
LTGLWKSFWMHAATLFSFFKEFHLCMRITRVHNESDVVLILIPYRQNRPLNDRRREIPPGHDMNVHFGDYTTDCPDVNIFVHVYPKIGEEVSQVPHVLSSGQIREASKINLSLNNEGIVESRFVPRADLPRGFSCCFSAPINQVIPPGNADQSALANVTLHDSSASTRLNMVLSILIGIRVMHGRVLPFLLIIQYGALPSLI